MSSFDLALACTWLMASVCTLESQYSLAFIIHIKVLAECKKYSCIQTEKIKCVLILLVYYHTSNLV